jgi:hypothetical protein
MITAQQIKEKIFIQAYAKTTVGLSTLDGPVFVSCTTNIIQTGKNVLEALKEAGKIIQHPTQEERKEMAKNDPMLKAAKMKTWNAMMKASKRLEIELENQKITITPNRFGGTSGDDRGYHSLDDKAIICETQDPETLGKALLQAFELCE